MPEPCWRCEVRSDIGCKHQPASGNPPIAFAKTKEKVDKRFKRPVASIFGAAGNPTRKEFDTIINKRTG